MGGGSATSLMNIKIEDLDKKVENLEEEYEDILQNTKIDDSEKMLRIRQIFDNYVVIRDFAISNSLPPSHSETFEKVRQFIKNIPEIKLTPRLDFKEEEKEHRYDKYHKSKQIK